MQHIGFTIPSRKPAQTRLPESQRNGQLPGWNRLDTATTIDYIVSKQETAQRRAAESARTQSLMENIKMFENMKKAAAMPVLARGRAKSDLSQNKDFIALKEMPLGEVFQVDYANVDAAKRAQSRINLYGRNGAGTFKTALQGATLYIQHLSYEYKPQRARVTDVTESVLTGTNG